MVLSDHQGGKDGGSPAPAVEAAPGGTLREFAEHLRATGQTCIAPVSGTQIWVPGATAELMRFPMTRTEPVEGKEVRGLLRQRGIWIVSYLLSAESPGGANCFLYLCRDGQYHMDRLRKNARRVIKRGLRNFTVRRCTWDELLEKGYPALADTDVRHGYRAPPMEELGRFVALRRDSKFHEVWGAWRGGELAGWLSLVKVDDWALFEASPSTTATLALAPNNAMRYEALRRLLVEEKRTAVLTGLSSINPSTDPRPLYEYNTRIGFDAVPQRRVFVPHPLLRPLLGTRMAYRMWKFLCRTFQQYSVLHKVAGMSRLLCGHEKNPLAWAEGLEGGEGADADGGSE